MPPSSGGESLFILSPFSTRPPGQKLLQYTYAFSQLSILVVRRRLAMERLPRGASFAARERIFFSGTASQNALLTLSAD